MSDLIHWEQAYESFKHNSKFNIAEAKNLIMEIETSSFFMYGWIDINFYVLSLNELSNRTDKKGNPKPYTHNEVREMNMVARGYSRYDMLCTFEGDPSDDVIDFY